MIHGMKGMPYESRLEELGLWTLEERRNKSDLIEVYKMTTGLSSLRLETFFKLKNSGITRGHSLNLLKQRSTSEMRQHFFSNRVVSIWNILDVCIVTAPSLNTFKAGLSTLQKKGMAPVPGLMSAGPLRWIQVDGMDSIMLLSQVDTSTW